MVDREAFGQNDSAFERVLQLPNVAGPRIFAKTAAGLGAEGERRFAELAAEFLEKMVGEDVDVIAAFAQRRNGERDG